MQPLFNHSFNHSRYQFNNNWKGKKGNPIKYGHTIGAIWLVEKFATLKTSGASCSIFLIFPCSKEIMIQRSNSLWVHFLSCNVFSFISLNFLKGCFLFSCQVARGGKTNTWDSIFRLQLGSTSFTFNLQMIQLSLKNSKDFLKISSNIYWWYLEIRGLQLHRLLCTLSPNKFGSFQL